MGRVFRALGMSVGRVLDNNHGSDKRAAFDADVTYVTASDLAWLYLSDNTSIMHIEQLVGPSSQSCKYGQTLLTYSNVSRKESKFQSQDLLTSFGGRQDAEE